MSLGDAAAERLKGKTVLLTGASSGIGKATAIELADAAGGELKLILSARRKSRLEELKNTLIEKYPQINILVFELDISDYTHTDEKLNKLPWEVDVLINNAGLALGMPKVGDIEPEKLYQVYATNVLGTIALSNWIIPRFRKRGYGDILFVGSIAGREAFPGGGVYSSSKFAIYSFVESLRKESIDTGIRVLEIDPGLVKTEFAEVSSNGDKEKAAQTYQTTTPLLASDVAEAIVFAVSRRRNCVIANTLILSNEQAAPIAVNNLYLQLLKK